MKELIAEGMGILVAIFLLLLGIEICFYLHKRKKYFFIKKKGNFLNVTIFFYLPPILYKLLYNFI